MIFLVRSPNIPLVRKKFSDRVDIIDKHRDDHGVIAITACYIGFLLPMMVEIQWWDKEWEREKTPAPA